MTEEDNWVIIGRFGRPHGIKGLITVISFTDPPDNIMTYQQNWHVRLHQQWRPVSLLSLTTNNKSILAQVAGYQEREEVAKLTHCEIAMPRKLLPSLEAGEYYWHQLIGMTVMTQDNILLGNVVEILATGTHDVLIIMGEKRHLIPYLPGRFIKDVNLDQRIIVVDWDKDFD